MAMSRRVAASWIKVSNPSLTKAVLSEIPVASSAAFIKVDSTRTVVIIW